MAVLEKYYRRIHGSLFARLKQGKKNILASKAVVLNDGKKGEGGGRPPTGRGGRVTHFWDVLDELKGLGTGLAPPGGEGHQSLGCNRGTWALPGGVVWGW